jgi:hypothetical protein
VDQKRTLEEIDTLYALEPEVCDVYVEGATDKHFLDWYFRRKGYSHVTVYPIDVIDVPDDVVKTHCFSARSNRSKVVALSCELAQRQASQRRVMCVVDRDSDDGIDRWAVNPYLFTTDGNSLELYALTPTVIEKFLLVALGGFPIAADSLIQKIVTILEAIFSIRQANERMALGMKWIPFCSYIEIDGLNVSFRESDFIRAYLQKNNKWSHQRKFLLLKDEIQRNLSRELSKRIRGHDLSELLHKIIRKVRRDRAFTNSVLVEGCLMASIESSDLEGYPLFVALERHAKSV